LPGPPRTGGDTWRGLAHFPLSRPAPSS
jgi:hypothetical protein